jgi:hypothetical protein
LKFTTRLVITYKPNNAQNIAPGHYTYYNFVNDTDAPTPPFKAKVKDGMGNVIKTIDFPAFAAHQGGSVYDVAPYECGWSRTVELDTENSVGEYSESNNTTTYQKRCVVMPPVVLNP